MKDDTKEFCAVLEMNDEEFERWLETSSEMEKLAYLKWLGRYAKRKKTEAEQ